MIILDKVRVGFSKILNEVKKKNEIKKTHKGSKRKRHKITLLDIRKK